MCGRHSQRSDALSVCLSVRLVAWLVASLTLYPILSPARQDWPSLFLPILLAFFDKTQETVVVVAPAGLLHSCVSIRGPFYS